MSFPHSGGVMVPDVQGSISNDHEDSDDGSRRRELRLLKNKSVMSLHYIRDF